VQSLIATCRLQGIDPYIYLIDVLQRVGQHSASRVAELTPRLWKSTFADNPLALRSTSVHQVGTGDTGPHGAGQRSPPGPRCRAQPRTGQRLVNNAAALPLTLEHPNLAGPDFDAPPDDPRF